MSAFSRRHLLRATALGASVAVVNAVPIVVADNDTGATALVASARPDEVAPHIDAASFGIVGVFDADWLTEPRFTRLLDNLAASPGAFMGVRFFGALSSGTRENVTPTSGGTLWPDAATPPDFSATFAALYALTSRGLTPFVQLSFFPTAIAPTPIAPPTSLDRWQSLVRAFLDGLAADPRFGVDAMRTWWFEVWNEPNIPVFWGGTFAQYLDLYRATAATVRASGYPIRLGGPALAYLPATAGDMAGMPLMRQFLTFLRDEPEMQCDFVSYHAKGTWAPDGEADLVALTDAATETAMLAQTLIPERCRDLLLINNEADERVGFDTPYAPRMDERNPAWLAASLIAHDIQTVAQRTTGPRFAAAADNANLQLVQRPFDGRRSLLTRASSTDATDLLKVPAYGFYELVRLLGDRHGTILAGAEALYPATDLFHLLTVAETHIAALFTVHPHGVVPARPWTMNYTLDDLPWETVNVALFGIDHTHSNGFTEAGGQLSPPWPDATAAARIRQGAELAMLTPIQHAVAAPGGTLTTPLALAPYTTALLWITPMGDAPPAAPAWVMMEDAGANVIVRWEPSRDAAFYSHAVARIVDGRPGPVITPEPLRAALWVDTAPTPRPLRYAVRTTNASGITSNWTLSTG